MYAHITSEGRLRIGAETPLESYALKKWSDDYFKNFECSGRGEAILEIIFAAPQDEENNNG